MSAPTIEGKLWRCDYAGNRLEDVSEIVIDAKCDMNPENDQTWSLSATVDYGGYQRLTPYVDWLAPEMIVTWPNGVIEQGQLGLYFAIESPVAHRETSGRVALRAVDPLWLVARQGFTNRLEVRSGTKKDRVLRQILDGAVLTDDESGHRRFVVPEFPDADRYRFKKDMEYPRTENRLDVGNEVAQGLGCYNLWTSKLGIMLTKRMGDARLRQRTPVATFSAHVPESVALAAHQLNANDPFSDVVGVIDTSPFDESLLNEILMVNDDPNLPRINVRGRVRNSKNPRSTFRKRKRRRTRKIHNPVIDDEATAQEVADALLDELSTRNHTATLHVLPRPAVEFARETVDCFVWNAFGVELLNGQYAVHSVSYGFTPRSGTMALSIGRIDDAAGALEDDDE